MNYGALARKFDAQDCPIEATWAYELAIREPIADLDLYFDLVGVYFACQDGGYVAAHRLNSEFIGSAYYRLFEILDEAEARFGTHTEIEFWRLYVREIVLGADLPDEVYEALARQGDSLMPHYRLYINSSGTRYQEEVKALLSQVRDGSTERKRYIRSVLESAALPRLS